MSNPFLSTGTSNSSSNVKVNNKSPNFNGNIQLSISDIPNLQTTLNNLTQGVSAQQLSQLTDVSISTPLNNQSILYDSATQKYKNKAQSKINWFFFGLKSERENQRRRQRRRRRRKKKKRATGEKNSPPLSPSLSFLSLPLYPSHISSPASTAAAPAACSAGTPSAAPARRPARARSSRRSRGS